MMTYSNNEAAIASIRQMHEVQGQEGNWNYSEYMTGFYNALELVMATLEGREPIYRESKDNVKIEIDRLAKFIMSNYPNEIGLGNPREGESAVDVAIRLLNKQPRIIKLDNEGKTRLYISTEPNEEFLSGLEKFTSEAIGGRNENLSAWKELKAWAELAEKAEKPNPHFDPDDQD